MNQTSKIPELIDPAGEFRDQRTGSVACSGHYGRVCRRDRAPARHTSRGQPVRQRTHCARTCVLPEGRAYRAPAVRRGLLGDLRRRTRTDGSGQSRCACRTLAGDRPQHHAAARAGRQSIPGCRHQLPLFLRPQDDVRALRVRVRGPARRLRHDRRADRMSDAGADREDAARFRSFWSAAISGRA